TFALSAAELDVLVHGDAFDDSKPQTRGADILLQRRDGRLAPGRSHRHIIERAHDITHSRDLPDVLERDRVISAEPAKRHPHEFAIMSFTLHRTSIAP